MKVIGLWGIFPYQLESLHLDVGRGSYDRNTKTVQSWKSQLSEKSWSLTTRQGLTTRYSNIRWRLGKDWRLVKAVKIIDNSWRSLSTRDSKSRWRLGNGLTTRQLSILASFDSQSFTLHFIKSKTPLMHQLKLKTCMEHTNNQYKYLGI